MIGLRSDKDTLFLFAMYEVGNSESKYIFVNFLLLRQLILRSKMKLERTAVPKADCTRKFETYKDFFCSVRHCSI